MKRCAITGANGYLGKAMVRAFGEAGWVVESLVRRPEQLQTNAHRFVLGETCDPKLLSGVDVLIHCAWDFSPGTWDDYVRINVDGSKELFDLAVRANVENLIFISSMSAHDGCRSNYGRAKLRCEEQVLAHGGAAIRPGLVWGGDGSGLHGAIEKVTRRLPVVPILSGSLHSLHMCHVDDLARFLCSETEKDTALKGLYIAADKTPWPMRKLVSQIAAATSKFRIIVPIPWRLVWWLLRGLESIGIRPPFRSDSVLGLVRDGKLPDPNTYSDGFRPYDTAESSVK